MSDKNEEKEIAKEWRDICWDEANYAKGRSNYSSDEFCKNLLQISSIIFAIATASLGQVRYESNLIKWFFVIGLGSLVLSLAFGIINTNLKGNFWEEVVSIAHKRYKYFDKARRGEITLESAEIGAKEATGGKQRAGSPKWAWIIQSLLTFVGIILIGISTILIIFK